MQKTLIFLIAIFLVGCVSEPKKVEQQAPPPPTSSSAEPDEESIDVTGLQKSLRMTRDAEDLGYVEKQFESCRAGFGLSPIRNCRPLYLVVVHFRLQCRDSEGTVSEVVTNAELRAITTNNLRWNFGKVQGVTKTDGEGFGQVVAIAPSPSRKQRFRLTRGNDFLALPAGDVRRIIVPRTPWCE